MFFIKRIGGRLLVVQQESFDLPQAVNECLAAADTDCSEVGVLPTPGLFECVAEACKGSKDAVLGKELVVAVESDIGCREAESASAAVSGNYLSTEQMVVAETLRDVIEVVCSEVAADQRAADCYGRGIVKNDGAGGHEVGLESELLSEICQADHAAGTTSAKVESRAFDDVTSSESIDQYGLDELLGCEGEEVGGRFDDDELVDGVLFEESCFYRERRQDTWRLVGPKESDGGRLEGNHNQGKLLTVGQLTCVSDDGLVTQVHTVIIAYCDDAAGWGGFEIIKMAIYSHCVPNGYGALWNLAEP